MHTQAMPNNAINADSQRRRFALLLAAGYVKRRIHHKCIQATPEKPHQVSLAIRQSSSCRQDLLGLSSCLFEGVERDLGLIRITEITG